jgi:hypothetical protein
MSFVLVTSDSATPLSPAEEAACMDAGALSIIPIPLCPQAVNRIVGHIKAITRPSARALGSGMAHNLVQHITNDDTPRLASHRPDEVLSVPRRLAVEEAVAKWNFPAHAFDMDELSYAALVMLEHVLQNPLLKPYRLSRSELMTFILAARREYKHEREVHYHNWRHAVDVTQSLYVFLCNVHLCPRAEAAVVKETTALERLLTPTEALILLVSAIGHDVGHPGVNNAFLVASNHHLARIYNDKSVLENYHCAAYSQLLRRHWPALSTITHFRSTMISTILATDMQRHFEYMGYLSDLKQKIEKSTPDLADWSEKDKVHARDLVMALLLKAADISNVARPFDISSQWAKILMHEFARQGQLESELQIPTCLFGGPPDEKDLLAAAQSQKGFMNLFSLPLFRGISEVMPQISCTLTELESNKQTWEKKIADETLRRGGEGVRRSSRTYGSVTDSQVEEARMHTRESEPTAISTPQSSITPVRRQPGIESGLAPSNPASDIRQRLQTGTSLMEGKRAPDPIIRPNVAQLALPGESSRRSSKDVALNHMHELNTQAQQNLATIGSRRGSTDTGWQLHQNYPGSRRGSKEESLTTILVTSQGSPANRGSPASSHSRLSKSESPGKSGGLVKQRSFNKTRPSVPSSRSQTTTSVTGTTDQQSPSTQSSSPAPTEQDTTQPVPQHGTLTTSPVATATAYSAQSDGLQSDPPHGLDGSNRALAPNSLPGTPAEAPGTRSSKSDSPHIIARVASDDSAISRVDGRKHTEPQIRESRSRTRLRGLKFWRKRRDTGIDAENSP